jgi:conjugal transfer pilus assembly protein TraD
MPSSNKSPEPGVDPQLPLEQLTHWLVVIAVHVMLGVALGILAARLMRARHLHWSWAALGLGGLVLARPLLRGATSTLCLVALSAMVRGRSWHCEDIDAGADLAEIAADRLRPVDVLGCLARRTPLRRGRAPGADGAWCGGRLVIGRDESGRQVSIPFGGLDGGTHTLVLGATGSGKTVTQSWMAVQAIERGMGAVVVDPKGDRGMRDRIRQAARAVGRPFIEWTPLGPSVYNPYARGSETEIADKVLAGERFTEPHYLRQAQRHLGHVVRALRRAGLEVSLQSIVTHLDADALEHLVRQLPQAEAQATYAYLDSRTARQQSDLAGVRDRLAILTESDVGPWLDPQTVAGERFDVLQAVSARAVVYFNLESDSRPLLTQMLGAAIVQDLQTTVAALQGRPTPTLVVIDEFSALAAEQVVRLFGRARSAGFSLALGAQELSDMRLPARDGVLEQVMGNLSALIAHRQVVPDSAALVASLAGTKGAWRTSRHSAGGITRTRIRQGVLDPTVVMGLGQGRAAVIVLAGAASVRITRIFSPKQPR